MSALPSSLPREFQPVAVESPGGGRVRDKRDPAAPDIVPVGGISGAVPMHRLAARAWTALAAAARADGIAAPLLLPVSGYRSSEHQQRLWAAALARYGSPQEARRWVAPPGGSAHQSGRAIDFYLGGRNDSANVAHLRTLPAYRWLAANAQRFGFYPYEAEPWHWEYNPPAGAADRAPAVALTPLRATASSVRAGCVLVPHVPALAGHRGRPPAAVLRWNDMRTAPAEIDVVVHLHGFSRPGLTLPSDIEPVSGLDLRGRTRPTLTILPRGNDTGVQQRRGSRFVYTFPALDGRDGRRDGLARLIDFSLQRFAQATGAAPRAGRRILTAHSGGGLALLRMLAFVNPDEVHAFDALYAPPDALADWVHRRRDRDRRTREPGALRVFYSRDGGTADRSRRLRAAIGPLPPESARRYRVELSALGHMEIPRAYGWRMLADASSDVPHAGVEPVHGRRPTHVLAPHA